MANLFTRHNIFHGQVTGISGLPIQIPDYNDLYEGVTVVSYSGSTSTVFVGGSGVTIQNGFHLDASTGVTFHVSTPSVLWLVSTSGSNNAVSWYGS